MEMRAGEGGEMGEGGEAGEEASQGKEASPGEEVREGEGGEARGTPTGQQVFRRNGDAVKQTHTHIPYGASPSTGLSLCLYN
ncbi:hypothetical protein NHX12_008973, partial [Muraenolepis orangiensis]